MNKPDLSPQKRTTSTFGYSMIASLPFLLSLVLLVFLSTSSASAETATARVHSENTTAHTRASLGESGCKHIPFDITKRGLILVHANISGKEFDCLLDTGAPTCLWGSNLGVPIKTLTGQKYSSIDAMGNHEEGEECVLDSVKLGEYEMKDLVGVVQHRDQEGAPSVESARKGGIVAVAPILNSCIFQDKIAVVDYDKKEIRVYDSVQSFDADTSSSQGQGASTLDLHIAQENKKTFQGLPVVGVKVEGLNAHMVLDTGWSGNSIGLFRSFFRKVQHLPESTHPIVEGKIDYIGAYGHGVLKSLAGLQMEIGDEVSADHVRPASFSSQDGLEANIEIRNVDGCLGYSVLQRFHQVTLYLLSDYVR